MTRKALAYAAIAAACGLAAACGVQGQPGAAPTVSEVSLTPASTVAGVPVSVALTVTSTSCVTVQALTVAISGSGRGDGDLPAASGHPAICPSGYTLRTGSRALPAGSYTISGGYELAGSWHVLPAQAMHVGNAGSAAAPSWDPGGSYRTTLDDEFTAPGVDTATWEEGWFTGSGAAGSSGPVNPGTDLACDVAGNVSQPGNGYLQLKLTHVASTCSGARYPYSGALVDTRLSFAQQGGSFEAQVYIPPAAPSAAGVKVAGWPAVWLNGPASVPWPQHGEIDLVEGLDGNSAAHLHYDDATGTALAPGWTSPAAYTGWHDVGASWDAARHVVTVYWDGTAVFTHQFPANEPEYLILGYSLGSAATAPPSFPATMLVNWVRAWL